MHRLRCPSSSSQSLSPKYLKLTATTRCPLSNSFVWTQLLSKSPAPQLILGEFYNFSSTHTTPPSIQLSKRMELMMRTRWLVIVVEVVNLTWVVIKWRRVNSVCTRLTLLSVQCEYVSMSMYVFSTPKIPKKVEDSTLNWGRESEEGRDWLEGCEGEMREREKRKDAWTLSFLGLGRRIPRIFIFYIFHLHLHIHTLYSSMSLFYPIMCFVCSLCLHPPTPTQSKSMYVHNVYSNLEFSI